MGQVGRSGGRSISSRHAPASAAVNVAIRRPKRLIYSTEPRVAQSATPSSCESAKWRSFSGALTGIRLAKASGMKVFQCACGARVFFENSACLSCRHELGFAPDVADLRALAPASDVTDIDGVSYRKCANYVENGVC